MARRRERFGSEVPRIFTPPLRELTPETSLGFAVIRFAEDVLGVDLRPWQRWFCIHALELLPSGAFRYRTVVLSVARQNGKSTLSQVLALWFMYVYGARLVIGTAQNLDISEEVWDGAVDMAEGVDDLALMIDKVSRSNGKKALVLDGGERYRVQPATRRGGRGLSGDLIMLDELREHATWEAWSAVTKDLPNSTPMLLEDGSWSTMGDLEVGDRVFAPSGDPVSVTAVHPVRELRPMYRVTMTDGRSLVASESHLWTVKDMRRGYDMATGWETLSTGDILARGLTARGGARLAWKVPLQSALVGIPERDLPIDPYLLGYWLGDGSSDSARVTVGAQDLAAFEAEVARAGYFAKTAEYRPGVHSVTVSTCPVRKGGVVGRDSMNGRLRALGVLGDKHVPDKYLTASSEQRLALLQGLLDSDGCATTAGLVKFSTARDCLADAVVFLARSLGWSPRKTTTRAKIAGRDCGPVWSVTFTPLAGDPVPFRLERKAARIGGTGHRPRLHASIASIVPVASEPSTCIAVDSADHLFTAGRDLVPTHNTTMARPDALILGMSNAGDAASIVLRHLRVMAHRLLGDPDGVVREAEGVADLLGSALEDAAPDDAITKGDAAIGWFEWSAPPGCDVWDVDGWLWANPSYGHVEMHRALESAAATDPEWVFRTECLCQWNDGATESIFPGGSWLRGQDAESAIAEGEPVTYCVEVEPDLSRSFIVAAGRRADGDVHVEVIATNPGTAWVVPWFKKRADTEDPLQVVCRRRGAQVQPIAEDLDDVDGVDVIDWGGPQLGGYCGRLFQAVVAHLWDPEAAADDEDTPDEQPARVWHRPQPVLDVVASTVVTRPLAGGDSWIWSATGSPYGCAPIMAASGAVGAILAPQDDGSSAYEFEGDFVALEGTPVGAGVSSGGTASAGAGAFDGIV